MAKESAPHFDRPSQAAAGQTAYGDEGAVSWPSLGALMASVEEGMDVLLKREPSPSKLGGMEAARGWAAWAWRECQPEIQAQTAAGS